MEMLPTLSNVPLPDILTMEPRQHQESQQCKQAEGRYLSNLGLNRG